MYVTRCYVRVMRIRKSSHVALFVCYVRVFLRYVTLRNGQFGYPLLYLPQSHATPRGTQVFMHRDILQNLCVVPPIDILGRNSL